MILLFQDYVFGIAIFIGEMDFALKSAEKHFIKMKTERILKYVEVDKYGY